MEIIQNRRSRRNLWKTLSARIADPHDCDFIYRKSGIFSAQLRGHIAQF